MEGSVGVKDYFWKPDCTFDPLDTDPWGGRVILYLHCGMHLYTDSVSNVRGKWTGLKMVQAAKVKHPTRSPLVVSEARSEDKLRSIRRSDYLSFAYRQLADFDGPLVISVTVSARATSTSWTP